MSSFRNQPVDLPVLQHELLGRVGSHQQYAQVSKLFSLLLQLEGSCAIAEVTIVCSQEALRSDLKPVKYDHV
jgi:hypothetical protein